MVTGSNNEKIVVVKVIFCYFRRIFARENYEERKIFLHCKQ